MKKIIYHGSDHVIEKPVFGLGNSHNDYGFGFYCTFDMELAKEWAVNSKHSGFANKYEIDISSLRILDLKKYTPLHWLTILLENRIFNIYSPLGIEAKEYLKKNFLIDYKSYDVIIGYRADDSYFTFAKDFISGVISYQQLVKAIRLGNLGEQFVLISQKAFDSIKFIKAIEADQGLYLNLKNDRDAKARKDYADTRKMKRNKNDLYIAQIIDKEIKEEDERL